MKKRRFSLGVLPVLCGAVGLVLYMILLATGRDDRQLLVSGHWAGIALLVFSGLVSVGLLLLVRPLNQNMPKVLFPRSVFGAVGGFLAAGLLIYSSVRSLLSYGDTFGLMSGVLGLAAGACLVLTSLARLKGSQPGFGPYGLITLFFMVRLIDLYRDWSAQPQLLEYLFSLLASVALMVTGYLSAALPMGKGSRKWFVFFNRAALYFSCVSLAGSDPLFYLAMAIWTGTSLCSLREERS